MTPNGNAFPVKVHIKRPKAIRRWVYVLARALGRELPDSFLVTVEVVK